MPLIQMLKLDELVDPRLGDSYGMYELYQMARVAYLCIQTKPAMRPTVAEVYNITFSVLSHCKFLIDLSMLHFTLCFCVAVTHS